MLIALGGNPAGGHVAIIDGYNSSNDTFHINWGWGPGGDNDNGAGDWYSLSAPLNLTTSRGTFTFINGIVYDIAPPTPTVTEVSSTTGSGTYGIGTTIPITVTFSERLP